MKGKTIVIIGIVVMLITLLLAWISSNVFFAFEIPWYVISAPITFQAILLICVYLPSQKKENKDDDKKK